MLKDAEFRSEMIAHVLLVGRRCQFIALLYFGFWNYCI